MPKCPTCIALLQAGIELSQRERELDKMVDRLTDAGRAGTLAATGVLSRFDSDLAAWQSYVSTHLAEHAAHV